MNNSSFARKIIYIAIIACLLIPLSLVSRPASRDAKEGTMVSGGMLAKLRDEHKLSQSNVAEIDPASETMKLASLGLRGVAVNLLWMQAIDHKKKEQWNQFESTLNALVKIQPNFIKVWEYQAHNMSYNISMEFDDYQYRYHWVKKGIKFLTKGLAPNYRDHRMTDNLGFFTGLKLGNSDEKTQFRRLFRGDDKFHTSMEEYIDPQSYETRYGHDNWKMAYQWYQRSENLVDDRSAPRFSSDMMFYRKRPAQLRNLGAGQQQEFRADEAIREIWGDAYREWLEYGERPLRTVTGQTISLEDLVKTQEELELKREELDALAPEGLRDRLKKDLMSNVTVSTEEQRVMDLPSDQRTDREEVIARKAQARIARAMLQIDQLIAQQVDPDKLLQARRINEEIGKLMNNLTLIDRNQGTVNYRHWRIRTKAEMSDLTVRARQLLFDAEELARKSIFDDEYEIDAETGEKKITQVGAISKYESAFRVFKEVFDQYPALLDGDLSKGVTSSLYAYQNMLKLTGLEWPDEFPMQDFVDYQYQKGALGLPSSEILLQRKLDRGEITEEEYERLSKKDEEEKSEEDKKMEKRNPDERPDVRPGTEEKNEDEAGDDETEQDDKSSDDESSDDDSSDKKNSDDNDDSLSTIESGNTVYCATQVPCTEESDGNVDVQQDDENAVDTSAKSMIKIEGPGLVKEKPESGPFVEIEGGYMVPYTTQIPGTDVTFEMIPIPGGTYMMGSPEDEKGRNADEGPQVEIVVEPFWMGKYEVTWGEYKPFMRLDKVFKEFKRRDLRVVNEETKIDAITAPSALYDPSFTFDAGEDPDQPCATIAQYAAKQYTKYLSLLTGTYYRLPFEGEWEYACRGGTTTPYHFGSDPKLLTEYGWFEENSDEYRMPVGQLKPNPYGLYDMYGNANEWVLGQYVENGYKNLEGKSSPASATYNTPTELHPRVCRGGSFELKAEDCRSAARQKSEEDWRDRDPNTPRSPWWLTSTPSIGVGFRLVRPLHEPASREEKEKHWAADLESIEYDAANRIRDNGKGAYGIVDPDLPNAIKGLSEDK